MTVLWHREEVEAALGVQATGDFEATGVKLDSRELSAGDLFIALKGPHHDGAQYAAQAFEKGAAAAIFPEEASYSGKGTCLYVRDTLKALCDLAEAARSRSSAKIIGITGSFGKTSTKDALRLILKKQSSVTANTRSFNNHWGVPFTLANLKPQDAYGIIEMGMNHVGEIDVSSRLARPHVALVTNIREMHMEALGSLEAIADAKCEIFEGMSPGGKIVLNTDDRMFERALKTAQRYQLEIISFGKAPSATLRLQECWQEKNQLFIRAILAGQLREFSLVGMGEHWACNSLGVLGVIHALGLDMDSAIQILQTYQLPEGRGVQHRISYRSGEILLIDESYNAGPDSMRAALNVLGKVELQEQSRRIAILGDMRELGERAIQQHQSLRDILLDNKIDLVFTCGILMKHLYDILPSSMKAGHTEEVADLIPLVLQTIQPGDIVMSKGSKGQYAQRGRMYGFVEAILKAGKMSPSHHGI